MPKLPRLSGKEVIKILGRLGFVYVRQKGSHVVLKKVEGKQEFGCVVPMHKELATGTLHGILRQAKVSVEEFLAVYER
ncbi:type II toxin-antitoxin system HicA family toxin [Candidatus Peregrinibacteria bacterium]|nr:MAG: type II toxin-antitoxin system HicA family toxin [Candidatus Peregrinibacteria bacterium]